MLTSRVLLVLILILRLAAPPQPLLAQQSATEAATPTQSSPQAPASPPVVESLKVLILEGDGAINSIERHTATIPVVEIRDDNDKPVEGAEVIFRLPVTGPGGAFPDNKSSKVSKTTVQGQAAATGFTPNDKSGRFEIQVTASIGNRIGKGTVSQINATGVKLEPVKKQKGLLFGIGWKKVAIIGGIATAGIVIALIATRGGSSSSGNPTITITPGPITIGGR